MRILFYTPVNTRCRDIESQALAFRKKGHEIFLLTQSKEKELHRSFREHGFSVFSTTDSATKSSYAILAERLFHLVMFCWKYKIQILYSHLEPANFIAVIAQPLVKAKVVICRHHMDYAKLNGFDRDLSYRITYTFAKNVIVVSEPTRKYMMEKENGNAKKIHVIKLAYNFGLFKKPEAEVIASIRNEYLSDLILVTVCRLTPFKRPNLSVRLLKNLRDLGINAKLFILGEGNYRQSLEQEIADLNMTAHVVLTGYVTNVLDYLGAADVLVHPSISESSCITVKEAGFVSLPVIACKHVGDFDEVIRHEANGYLLDVDHFLEQATSLLKDYTNERSKFVEAGKNLRETILSEFDIKNVVEYYENTFHC